MTQFVTEAEYLPQSAQLKRWAKAALNEKLPSAEITIRVVDPEEMTMLNETFRHKNGPTNVLSFPFDADPGMRFKVPPLGDIAICADVVNREADEQGKEREAHWAHMVIHGVLHLLGHDHQEDHEAEVMEAEEIRILQTFGFTNPYDLGDKHDR